MHYMLYCKKIIKLKGKDQRKCYYVNNVSYCVFHECTKMFIMTFDSLRSLKLNYILQQGNTAFFLRNWSNFAFVFPWCSRLLCNNSIYDATDDGEKPCTNFVSALCFFQTDNIIHYLLSIRKISADVTKMHSQCN